METQCYNCKGFGHWARDCPTPHQNQGNGKKGKKGKGKKGSGNAENVEGTFKSGNSQTPATTSTSTTTPAPSTTSTPAQTNTKPPNPAPSSKTPGQSNLAKEIDYVYMAEPVETSSDEEWSDDDDEDDEILIPLSPQFLNSRRPTPEVSKLEDEEVSEYSLSDTEDDIPSSNELESFAKRICDMDMPMTEGNLRLLWQVNATVTATQALSGWTKNSAIRFGMVKRMMKEVFQVMK
ncbi:hypothetical protein D9758_010268 [Tetrapyrgos nigripes]|uniref:CCHC-type domain-containing protein n=1 Tax=Tetrapyrgos nigripes TaxID=182062 RepID=A0A8H5GAN8_9AGAR|nr:hypothetical protein D9758_010268 [Tetrapyrgos nigripes]